MGIRTQVEQFDDLDGTVPASTFSFAVQGVGYEVDLSQGNVEKFMAAVAPFIKVARRQKEAPATTPAATAPAPDVMVTPAPAPATSPAVSAVRPELVKRAVSRPSYIPPAGVDVVSSYLDDLRSSRGIQQDVKTEPQVAAVPAPATPLGVEQPAGEKVATDEEVMSWAKDNYLLNATKQPNKEVLARLREAYEQEMGGQVYLDPIRIKLWAAARGIEVNQLGAVRQRVVRAFIAETKGEVTAAQAKVMAAEPVVQAKAVRSPSAPRPEPVADRAAEREELEKMRARHERRAVLGWAKAQGLSTKLDLQTYQDYEQWLSMQTPDRLLADAPDTGPQATDKAMSRLRSLYGYETVYAWAIEQGRVFKHGSTLPTEVYQAYERSLAKPKRRNHERRYPVGIREWGRANGHKVPNGKLGDELLAAFAAAHPES